MLEEEGSTNELFWANNTGEPEPVDDSISSTSNTTSGNSNEDSHILWRSDIFQYSWSFKKASRWSLENML